MNLKQFLKPDWRKFYLFSILSFFFIQYPTNGKFDFIGFITFIVAIPIIIALISFSVSAESLIAPVDSYKIIFKPQVFATTVALFYFIVNFLLYLHDSSRLLFGTLTIFLLIPSYIMSCLIVWVYNKFRKRK